MRPCKYDLIVIVCSILAVLWIGLIKTRYDVELNSLANSKLDNMPNTIGQYWTEGEIPVQVGYFNTVDLGHTSLNPFDYETPSINVVGKDNLGNPLIVDFTTRAMLPEEKNITLSFRDGDFIGLREFTVILAFDFAYLTGRLLIKPIQKHVDVARDDANPSLMAISPLTPANPLSCALR